MNFDLDLIQCVKCGKVREKFLVGCPNCGVIENRKVDPNSDSNAYYEINLEIIKKGADFFKRELEDEQKKWLQRRIPSGQNWQFYAGITASTRLSMIWLKPAVPFEVYSVPLSVTNSRVYYVVSFMTKEKQENFCHLLNSLNPKMLELKDEEDKRNLQRKTTGIDDDSSTGEL